MMKQNLFLVRRKISVERIFQKSITSNHKDRRFSFSFNPTQSYSSSISSQNSSPIWISASLNPWFNLSFEEFLFRQVDLKKPLLFIYRNSPSVIIGRNQNPWQEARLDELESRNINLVRRRSGGGTVYHDEGNTNYSIMVPREDFDRITNALIIADSIKKMGIKNVEVTDRHDVCVSGKKVSGSAFRIVAKRAYHHGTMLISSDLDQLRGSLGSSRNGIVDSRAVASVRSPVTSLVKNSTDAINHQSFIDNLRKAFISHYYPSISTHPGSIQVDEGEIESNEFVKTGYDELRSWEWTFGQTPAFSELVEYDSQKFKIKYINGAIKSHEIVNEEDDLESRSNIKEDKLIEGLLIDHPIGKRYV